MLTVGSADGKACLLPNLGGTANIKPEEVQYIRQTLRDVTVGVTLIDSVVEGANFSDPITYLMNSNYIFAASATQEKRVSFIFKTVKVMTDRGIIAEDFKSEETYSIEGAIFDAKDRDPNDKIKFVSPEGETYQPIPYLTLKFLSGNSRQEYTRKYIKILDILGLVGGITEVLSFVITILYSWYNGIRMEQDIINYTILHLDPDDETIEQWEKSRELTFWNVFKFHYFTCCAKKDPKFKVFESSQQRVGEQTSVGHMIDSINYVEIMKQALLTPGQRRAMRFTDLNTEDLSDSESTKGDSENKLNATESVKMLKSSKDTNAIEERVNKFLLKNLPAPLVESGMGHSVQPSFGTKFNSFLNDDDRPMIQQDSGKNSPTHANPGQVSPSKSMKPKGKKPKLPHKL